MSEIKRGSVVRLKSGGPSMTVAGMPAGKFECLWFVNDEIRTAVISGYALVNVQDLKASPKS